MPPLTPPPQLDAANTIDGLTANTHVEQFPNQHEPTAVMTLRHPASEHCRTKKAAWLSRLSMNAFVREAVREKTDAIVRQAEEAEERNADQLRRQQYEQ